MVKFCHVDFGDDRGAFNAYKPEEMSQKQMGLDVTALRIHPPFTISSTVNIVTLAKQMPAHWETLSYVTWDR